MYYLPLELINIILLYFKPKYDDENKRKLELGQKEERVCEIMNQKLINIIEEEMDKIKHKVDDIEAAIFKNIIETIEGKIEYYHIVNTEDYSYMYNEKEKNMVNDIEKTIQYLGEAMNNLENVDKIIECYSKLYAKFRYICKLRNKIHYLINEKLIYKKIIDIYLKIKNLNENNLLSIYPNKLEELISYYEGIYTFINKKYTEYVTEKESQKNITDKIYYLYRKIKEKYGYNMDEQINTVEKMIKYYGDDIDNSFHRNKVELLSSIEDDLYFFQKYIVQDEHTEEDVDIPNFNCLSSKYDMKNYPRPYSYNMYSKYIEGSFDRIFNDMVEYSIYNDSDSDSDSESDNDIVKYEQYVISDLINLKNKNIPVKFIELCNIDVDGIDFDMIKI